MHHLSEHASIRMQQRGIPHVALDCLLEYGRVQHDHRGGAIVFFDKSARRRLKGSLPRARGGGLGWGKIYAVIAADGTITTVGHRYKRIPRP